MMYRDDFFGSRMPFMQGRGFGLWELMILGGVILIVVAIVLYLVNQKSSSRKDSATSILDERYARGDITEEEYLRRKENLKK